eukprot:TRINITY_DN16877_c0_g1_i1.p1 TRINITY_DN16877_c0_g1~~TRINITY_DN16877_c0_g1_i1.p1  ORF type:complete len:702 (+),score=83.99 TRINITY_DN16877_c0_g1_i1:32-2107(+)
MTSASMALIFGGGIPAPPTKPKNTAAVPRRPSEPRRESLKRKDSVEKLEGALMCVEGERMGMGYKVVADFLNGEEVGEIVDGCFKIAHDVFSPEKYYARSEVAAINSMRPNEHLKPSNYMCEVLKAVDLLNSETLGLFDPTVETYLEKYSEGLKMASSAEEFERNRDAILKPLENKKIGWKANFTYCDGKKILTKHTTYGKIDLSGIAKGWCVDVIYNRLKLKGAKRIYVNWGGDIRCGGPKDWEIPVLSPPPLVEVFSLWRTNSLSSLTDPHEERTHVSQHHTSHTFKGTNMAVATSGDYASPFKYGFYPTLNPLHPEALLKSAQGLPGDDLSEVNLASVSVVSPTCMYADALATCILALGKESELQKWLKRVADSARESLLEICIIRRGFNAKIYKNPCGESSDAKGIRIRDFTRNLPHQVALISDKNTPGKFVFALDSAFKVDPPGGERLVVFIVEKESALSQLVFINETYRMTWLAGSKTMAKIASDVGKSPLMTTELANTIKLWGSIVVEKRVDGGDRWVFLCRGGGGGGGSCLVTGGGGASRFYKRVESKECIPVVAVSKDGKWLPGLHLNTCSVNPPAVLFAIYHINAAKSLCTSLLTQDSSIMITYLYPPDHTTLPAALRAAPTFIPTSGPDRLPCKITTLTPFRGGVLVTATPSAMSPPPDNTPTLLIPSVSNPVPITLLPI